MDASEQKLISDLFARMRGMQGIDKDHDAASLIDRETAANPDAAYLLTQSVLVQEQALQKANQRIAELETQVSELQTARPAAAATAVPQAGFGARPSAVPASGVGRGAPMGVPAGAMAANDAGREAPGRDRAAEGRGAQSGGFMAQAMTTAAGVAGGMLLASGISSLFSGSNTDSSSASATDTASATPTDTSQQATETAAADQQQDAAQDDNFQQASHDDAAGDDDWGFGDMGDFGDFGDMDI
jgi:hypothetical protein